ncbi:MAG: hypothetical protein Fur0012_05470 [Elusimicrobiota bacterium]
MPDNNWVFVTEEKLPPARTMAEAVAATQGMIFYEAMAFVVKNYGFLGINLSFEKAAATVEACASLGIKSAIKSSDEIPVLKAAVDIKKIVFSESFLIYENQGIQLKTELKDLKLMAYAPLASETIKIIKEKQGPGAGEKAMRLGIMMATGLPIGLGKSKEVAKEVRQSETALYLELIFADGIRLRINSEHFDFSCLDEQKGYSSQTNFKNLCLKLSQAAPSAWKNSALFDLLGGAMAPTLKYENLSDLEKEEKRLLLAQLKNF